jgi:methyl-accepting chemotaxis protein
MDEVTQQNAALVEEEAAATESMQEQAQNLARVVSVFRLAVDEATKALPSAALVPGRRRGATVAANSVQKAA